MDVRTTRVFRSIGEQTLGYLLVEPINGSQPDLDLEGVTRYEGTLVPGSNGKPLDVSRGISVVDGAYVLASEPMSFEDAFASVNELSELVTLAYEH